MKQILVIDDDVHIGNVLEQALVAEDYGVTRAYSGTEALLLLDVKRPDLVLLDLMLPGLSGEEVLPKLSGIPVIVVSAKVDVDSKVNLLLEGAADYVTKPFELRELLVRIQVQLRKVAEGSGEKILSFGELSLDFLAQTLTVKGQFVKLTRTEFAILKLLMQNPKQIVTRNLLLERICFDTPDCTERSLKQHISNLRKKLENISGKDYIETVWGIGFKMAE